MELCLSSLVGAGVVYDNGSDYVKIKNINKYDSEEKIHEVICNLENVMFPYIFEDVWKDIELKSKNASNNKKKLTKKRRTSCEEDMEQL